MIKLKKKPSKMLFLLLIIALSVAILSSFYVFTKPISLQEINDHLYAGEIHLFMPEAELVQIWGSGEYMEGFGGHGREYPDKQTRIGIAGDRDNDFFGRVSSVTFANPEYELFGIQIGDTFEDANEKLVKHGFEQIGENRYENGEYRITLRGEKQIKSIGVGFSDKDLRDRIY